MSSAFEQDVRSWVAADDELKSNLETSRALREQKLDIQQRLTDYATVNRIEESVIRIADSDLRFTVSRSYPPLTFQYLKQCLADMIKDTDQVETMMNYIKNRRDVRESLELKRTLRDP